MPDYVTTSTGLIVLHLFAKATPSTDVVQVRECLEKALADDLQVVPVSVLGHKADLAVMILGTEMWRVRQVQTDLQDGGLDVCDSYVSLTEVSEYADGISEGMKRARLYPKLPIEGKPAWCFYPMSKRRDGDDNWYVLEFEKRRELMHGHGKTGREFADRVQQLVTGSVGLDDWEWGVTLFARQPDDLKDVVYTMRFDEGSARFAEFGKFYLGVVGSIDDVLGTLPHK